MTSEFPVRRAVSVQLASSPSSLQSSSPDSSPNPNHHNYSIATDVKKSLMGREYRYKPLKTATTIRILQLDPADGHAPLKGRLLRVDLETTLEDLGATTKATQEQEIARIHDIGPYEALSYVWGSQVLDREILCPDGRIPITQNLDEVLRAVRLTTEPRYVWADGVCIDQRNDRERGHQVKLMGAVYARALRVLIWLGQDLEGRASEAFRTISRMYWSNENWDQKETELLGQIVSKIWFTRVWVVQELFLSCAAHLLWGDAMMIYNNTFRYAMEAYLQKQRFSATHWITLSNWGTRVLDVLGCIRGSSCSDDRDRVYAILGLRYLPNMALSTAILGIYPDYNKSVKLLFAQVAYLCIKYFETQDLLAHIASSSSPTDRATGLPSWIPDWSRSGHHTPIEYRRRTTTTDTVEANRSTDAYTPKVDKLTLKLSVIGAEVTTVTVTTHLDLNPDDMKATAEAVSLFWVESIEPFKYLDTSRYHLMESHFVAALSGYGGLLQPNNVIILRKLFGREWKQNALFSLVQGSKNAEDMLDSLRDLSYTTPRELAFGVYMRDSPSYKRFWRGRRLFQTKHGFVGLGPADMRPGDVLAMISCSSAQPEPFAAVLRQRNGCEDHRFLGLAHVPGLDGDKRLGVWEELKQSRKQFQII